METIEEIDLYRSWLIRTLKSQVCVLKYGAGRLVGVGGGPGGFYRTEMNFGETSFHPQVGSPAASEL